MSFLHSPFYKERVRDVLNRWYNKIKHNYEHTPDDYFDRYYQYEDNNKWFYSIIKRIDDDKIRKSWIDKESKIDVKDELDIRKMYSTDDRLNDGVGVNITKFLNDLKHVCCFIASSRPLFITKDYSRKKKDYNISYLDLKSFRSLMETLNLRKNYKDGKHKDVNGWYTTTALIKAY